MSKIPQSFIDGLLAKVDIVDVIDARVHLKKAGKEHKACCPFHQEKSPSFTVSQAKQFYHCFGCGANGNAIGFLMDYQHLSFVEAVETLAASIGLEVPTEARQKSGSNKELPLYEILTAANDYYQQQLRQHADKEQAVDYLKNRGVSGQIAKTFGIGYAPQGWDNLRTALKQYSTQQLMAAGLWIESEKKGYDRFRQRIMFPIRDRRGRVIGFGGRVLTKDDEPKYLNSPETAVFHKRKELYGLYEALQSNRQLEQVVVVEGYMDVVALAQYGISYAVATLGTATTTEHLQQLFRQTNMVVFCFDGDRAGRDAAWKALQITLPVLEDGWQIKFMFLDQGEDPDSTVRKEGVAAFEKRLQQALPLSKYLFKHLSADIEMSTLDGQTKLAKLALPLIEQIPGKIFRHKLLEELALQAQIPINQLQGTLKQPETVAAPAAKATAKQSPNLMQHAISLLLQHPELAQQPLDIAYWQQADLPGAKLFAQLLELCIAQPHLTTGGIVEYWRDQPQYTTLTTLAARELLTPDAGLVTEFNDLLFNLQQKLVEQQLNELQRKLKQGELNLEDRQQYMKLLTQRQQYA